ncbi:hypothetical protein Slin14017_G088060 [Septoria linicola]|nr:hypothetical protein Slin14017_G088060 [Septoria linicola]
MAHQGTSPQAGPSQVRMCLFEIQFSWHNVTRTAHIKGLTSSRPTGSRFKELVCLDGVHQDAAYITEVCRALRNMSRLPTQTRASRVREFMSNRELCENQYSSWTWHICFWCSGRTSQDLVFLRDLVERELQIALTTESVGIALAVFCEHQGMILGSRPYPAVSRTPQPLPPASPQSSPASTPQSTATAGSQSPTTQASDQSDEHQRLIELSTIAKATTSPVRQLTSPSQTQCPWGPHPLGNRAPQYSKFRLWNRLTPPWAPEYGLQFIRNRSPGTDRSPVDQDEWRQKLFWDPAILEIPPPTRKGPSWMTWEDKRPCKPPHVPALQDTWQRSSIPLAPAPNHTPPAFGVIGDGRPQSKEQAMAKQWRLKRPTRADGLL